MRWNFNRIPCSVSVAQRELNFNFLVKIAESPAGETKQKKEEEEEVYPREVPRPYLWWKTESSSSATYLNQQNSEGNRNESSNICQWRYLRAWKGEWSPKDSEILKCSLSKDPALHGFLCLFFPSGGSNSRRVKSTVKRGEDKLTSTEYSKRTSEPAAKRNENRARKCADGAYEPNVKRRRVRRRRRGTRNRVYYL